MRAQSAATEFRNQPTTITCRTSQWPAVDIVVNAHRQAEPIERRIYVCEIFCFVFVVAAGAHTRIHLSLTFEGGSGVEVRCVNLLRSSLISCGVTREICFTASPSSSMFQTLCSNLINATWSRTWQRSCIAASASWMHINQRSSWRAGCAITFASRAR